MSSHVSCYVYALRDGLNITSVILIVHILIRAVFTCPLRSRINSKPTNFVEFI